MFSTPQRDYPLFDQQVRNAIAIRIAIVIAAFFGLAWSLLQWTLMTEQRFMMEGITRDFVQLEAVACAVAAVVALLYGAVRAAAWVVTAIRIRREQSGAAQRLAMQRVSAYV
ncbi:MAG TPA: hypothetical protein VEC01_06705 [Noviherbaspirillum sp.]|uniref:hypothetical protein n=1 Tax=Noviherbaspirillum sp. TaxID=1926288 RepID=UPI002D2F9B76|nr:hypothetical protein [Noviherbaspirillum sp.]HYD94998.1 hypothetical protein [Noviherbaspirillum sp.]